MHMLMHMCANVRVFFFGPKHPACCSVAMPPLRVSGLSVARILHSRVVDLHALCRVRGILTRKKGGPELEK